jgi:hypothetical protein
VPSVSDELARLQGQEATPTLEALFAVFIDPVLALNKVRKNGTTIFLQLLGRGYTDSQGHLRWFFVTHYGQVLDTFVTMIHQAHPELPASEVFWRLHFTLGTVVFTMASSEALIDIAKADFNEKIAIEGVIKRLVPYIAAGVGAS